MSPLNEMNSYLRLNMFVEDRTTYQGPIHISVDPNWSVHELKNQITFEFGIPVTVQRWILGKTLIEDEDRTLRNHGITEDGANIFLYIVSPGETAKGWSCPLCMLLNDPDRTQCVVCAAEKPPPPAMLDKLKGKISKNSTRQVESKSEEVMHLYKKLDDLDVIPNNEQFECPICMTEIEAGDGVVLRECLHTFCRDCMSSTIEHSNTPEVQCPFKDESYSCEMKILEREIKALVPQAIYERLQKRSLQEASLSMEGAFQCKSTDCNGWCVISEEVNTFKCPICLKDNCITCQAIHEGIDCKEYQQRLLQTSDEDSRKTMEWIEGLLSTGEALRCPSCKVLLLKKWGCDWVRCTYCRTEICWVTKNLRWGPAGRGDTSGGCRCLVDGRTKCHPLCNYCH